MNTFNHLKIAHLLWREHLKPGMTAVDATAGNGHDTLFLMGLVLGEDAGWVHAFDIQEAALTNTFELLKNEPFADRVTLHHASHERFPDSLREVDLIVYNLGYLPGGDKSITTMAESTLNSCKNALEILKTGGLLSLTLYPGHAEGCIEKNKLLSWLETTTAYCVHHQPVNSPKAPTLITLVKR